MRDEWTSWRIGRSRPTGFILTVAAFDLSLASVSCSQADRDSPLVPSQHHVQLPSLAPVVQAVIGAAKGERSETRLSSVRAALGEVRSDAGSVARLSAANLEFGLMRDKRLTGTSLYC
jgi:hypothetical protein